MFNTKMNFVKKLFIVVLFTGFIWPISTLAQTTATYSHQNVGETKATITGNVNGPSLGVVLLFGTISSFLPNAYPLLIDSGGVFSVGLTNLSPNTTYYYKLVYGTTALGPVKSFKTLEPKFILSSTNASQSSVVFHGSTTPGVGNFAIHYGKNPLALGGIVFPNVKNDGTFEQLVTGLEPNTKYYYSGFSIAGNLYLTASASFNTLPESVLTGASATSATTAKISGKITGNQAIRVYWGDSMVFPPPNQNDPIIDPVEKTWEVYVKDLKQGETYYYWVTKQSDPNFLYSASAFTTPELNVILQFFDVSDNSLTIKGSASGPIDDLRIVYATSLQALATGPKDFFPTMNGNNFEQNITGLAPNTTYYFVAVSKNDPNTIYGDPNSAASVTTATTGNNNNSGTIGTVPNANVNIGGSGDPIVICGRTPNSANGDNPSDPQFQPCSTFPC